MRKPNWKRRGMPRPYTDRMYWEAVARKEKAARYKAMIDALASPEKITDPT